MISLCSRDKTQCVEGDNIEGLVEEAWEYLCIKVANQSFFEDGVVSTQNGDEGRFSWSNQQVQSIGKSIVECKW